MNLTKYAETLREQLLAAAEMGGAEGKALIDRLSAGLDAATRLVLLEAISDAADEITTELAPGAVEVRLRGTDPEFVVKLPAAAADEVSEGTMGLAGGILQDGDEGGTSRLNLRLPETLKARIEEAARQEGLSSNAWLVRIVAAATDGPRGRVSGAARHSQRYTGWVS
ncbi:MAG: toxin-antitoxin system HicB family antitoxin [Acidimicrobiia bacterium]